MGFALGQTGSPTHYLQTASISDVSAPFKAWGCRFKPKGAGAAGDQIVFKAGGLEIHYDDTSGSERWYVLESRATTNKEYSIDQALLDGTEYDVFVYEPDDGGEEWFFGFRARSNSAGLAATAVAMTAVAAGSGAYTSQGGTPRWGANTAAIDTIADVRDCWFATHTSESALLADVENFGNGAAPFQFTGVTLQSMPRAIGTEGWDGRPGAATIVTTSPLTTYNVLGVAAADGPLADMDTGQSSAMTTGILARYRGGPRECIYTSANAIVEFPDLSGGLGHMFQLTSARQATLRTDREGRYYGSFDAETAQQYYNARDGAGRVTSGYKIASGGVALNGFTGSATNSSGWHFTAKANGAAQYWTVKQHTNAGVANNPRFGSDNNGQTTPTSQSPRIVFPESPTEYLVNNTDAATTTEIVRVGGMRATFTKTANNTAKYPYGLGRYDGSGANKECAFRLYEIFAWSVDKTSSEEAIISELRSRHRITARPKWGILTLGTSTEDGTGNPVRNYTKEAYKTHRTWSIVSAALGSTSFASLHLGGCSGGSGTFTRGNAVELAGTPASTAVFLAEADGQMTLYDRVGTWPSSGTVQIPGGAGATRNFTSVDNNSAAMNDTVYYNNYLGAISNYTNIRVWINFASGAIADTSGFQLTAAHVYAALRATMDRIRATIPRCWIGVRMHQPRSGGAGAQHVAYRQLLRVNKGDPRVAYALFDSSLRLPFDDYLTNSDYNNTTYYSGDLIHLVYAGHVVLADVYDNVNVPQLDWRDRSFSARGAIR